MLPIPPPVSVLCSVSYYLEPRVEVELPYPEMASFDASYSCSSKLLLAFPFKFLAFDEPQDTLCDESLVLFSAARLFWIRSSLQTFGVAIVCPRGALGAVNGLFCVRTTPQGELAFREAGTFVGLAL